jgi:excisionase family DNA binding protein
MTATLQEPPKEILPHLLKISEVAKHLAVSRQTVHNLIMGGELEAHRVNSKNSRERKHLRIMRDSLLKFYKKRFGHSLLDAIANHFQP